VTKRGILERLGTLLLAASFLGTAGADAWGLHECPHHDLVASAAPSGTPEPGVGDAHAMHGADGRVAAEAHDHGSHEDHEGHGPCTCVGHCQSGAGETAAIAGGSSGAALAHARSDQAVPAGTPDESLPGPPSFLLPFANAPPRVS